MATMMRSVRKPAMPMTIMPVMTRSVRESVRPSMMTDPNPVGTPVISPTTMSIHAKPCASLNPLKMLGVAAGSTTCRNMREPSQPSMDAASNSLWSTERTPNIVLSTIG